MVTTTRDSYLRYVSRELRNRGIERTPQEVWSAIVEDSGRNMMIAEDQLEAIAHDIKAFEGLARSFTDRRVLRIVSYPDTSVIFVAAAMGAIAGGIGVWAFVG